MSKKKEKKNAKKQLNIQGRIQKIVTRLLVISLLIIGIFSCVLNTVVTISTLVTSMNTLASEAAQHVNAQIDASMRQVELIGANQTVSNMFLKKSDKQVLLDSYMDAYDWKFVTVLNTIGDDTIYDSGNYSSEKYFQTALSGTTTLSEPTLNPQTGDFTITFAAPLWKDGEIGGTIIGVAIIVEDAKIFSDVMSTIHVSKNGEAYILDASGTTIASYDYNQVLNHNNTIEAAQSNSSLSSLAKIETRMINGETGNGTYMNGAVSHLIAFTPIGINDWSIAITAPYSDFIMGTIISVIATFVIMLVALIIGTKMAKNLGASIGKPINQCADRLMLLADGDLTTPVPQITTKDETKSLADATSAIVNSQHAIISDLSYVLEVMSTGDFTVKSNIGEAAYIGAYQTLIQSTYALIDKLSEALRYIKDGANEVSTGANQLSESAQSVAEGATDQAGAVEELQATIMDITGRVEQNAKASNDAAKLAGDVASRAANSTREIQDMTQAMERISSASQEIGNIIGEIEDIAEQTNLLSLNAAIEAARAGEAGRGFAVVADQIRKLAEQSSISAVNTRKLIEASLEEVENGNRITERTAQSMTDVINGLDTIAEGAKATNASTMEQAELMEQLEKGVEQISEVIQGNSAVAEEVSATSEELSAQAFSLDDLTGRFIIK
ncbi:MAG: HAMP domain-containing protein [Lachnospiraceae bacterium]|nr:HAMP domain-containing protein [Lachnospiraceae bacterium]